MQVALAVANFTFLAPTSEKAPEVNLYNVSLVPTKVNKMTNKEKLPQNGYYIKMDKMTGNIGELSKKNVDWNHILIQIYISLN